MGKIGMGKWPEKKRIAVSHQPHDRVYGGAELMALVKKPRIYFSRRAKEVFSQMIGDRQVSFADKPVVLLAINFSLLQGSYSEMCRWGINKGYKLCPPEVAIALRLARTKQPRGEMLVLAMEPVVDDMGIPRVLSVERQGKFKYLRAVSSQWMKTFSHAGCYLVFMK